MVPYFCIINRKINDKEKTTEYTLPGNEKRLITRLILILVERLIIKNFHNSYCLRKTCKARQQIIQLNYTAIFNNIF